MTTPQVGPVDWGGYDPGQLEIVMAVLLLQTRPTAWHRTPSSGDGGVDVVEPLPSGGYRVYQIKGFTGRHDRGRARQVAKSLEAVTADPRLDGPVEEWYLVAPIDLTSGEEDAFKNLTDGAPFPSTWLGEVFWHSEASKHPHVINYYLRDGKGRLERKVRALGELFIDTDSVILPIDALDRLGGIHEELNATDPHFRYDFSVTHALPDPVPRDGLIFSATHELSDHTFVTVEVFERYRGALEDRPVGGTLTFNLARLGEDAPALHQELEAFFGYGRELEIPDGVLDVDSDAPGGLGGHLEGAGGRIGPAIVSTFEPSTQRVRLHDGDGTVLDEAAIHLKRATRGSKGIELLGTAASGVFEVEARVTFGAVSEEGKGIDVTGTMQLHGLDPVGVPVRRALYGMRFLERLKPGRSLHWLFEYSDTTIAVMPIEAEMPDIPEGLRRVLEKLDRLQDLVPVPLLVPSAVTAEDGVKIERAVRLADGATLGGSWDHLVVCLERATSDIDRARAAIENGEPVAVEVPLTISLDGVEYQLGTLVQEFSGGHLETTTEEEDHVCFELVADDGSGRGTERLR